MKKGKKEAQHNADMSPSLQPQSIVRGNAIFNEIKVCFDCVMKTVYKAFKVCDAPLRDRNCITLSVFCRMERLLRSAVLHQRNHKDLPARYTSLHKNYKCIFRVSFIFTCSALTDISIMSQLLMELVI